jgi:hypothetical protein
MGMEPQANDRGNVIFCVARISVKVTFQGDSGFTDLTGLMAFLGRDLALA